ncbi:MFS transporter [Nocardioides sp. InS609-2]|uniref:MFS transporter n=1 Tax=Nocardioides sp. InS609-2 TaxID=2760705 RepID=UPI0020C06895|nr:MFS transporter [Nocardioides sp. InS609-2]
MTSCQTLPEPVLATPAFSWRPLLLLAFGAFWTVTLEMLPAGLLPAMGADLGVRPSRVGLLVTVWALTVGITTVPLSRATRRWRRPSVLAMSLVVLGLSTVLTAIAPTYLTVAATRLIAAAGHGLFWSVLLVYAASLAPEGLAGRAISVVLAGPILASVIGLPLGTWLAGPFGWRWVVGTVGAAMVLGALMLVRLLPDDDVPRVVPAEREGRDPTAYLVIGGALLGALALLAHFAVFTFVAPLSTQGWNLSADSVGPLLLVFGIAGAAGLGLSGAVPDRFGQHALIAVVALLAVTFAVLACLGDSPAAVRGLVAAWGLLLGMLPPLLQGQVIGVASPEFRDAAGAILVTVFNLGIAAGAVVGGQVIDLWGLDRLLPVAAVVSLLSAVGLGLLMRQRLTPTTAPMP